MELWGRALRDPGAAAARRRLDDRWREEIAEVIRAGQEAGEFSPVDPDDMAMVLASMLDGLAVQATLGDPAVSAERMRDLTLRSAELLLGCELATDGDVLVADSLEGAA